MDSSVAKTGETRDIYDALQHISIVENETWNSISSEAEQWCQYEEQQRDEDSDSVRISIQQQYAFIKYLIAVYLRATD